jgi:hypothetical protein
MDFGNVYKFSKILIKNGNSEFGKQVNSNGPHSAHGHSVTTWRAKRPRRPSYVARRARLRRGHGAPCGCGGASGKGSPAVELRQGGQSRHHHGTEDPPGKVEAAWAHRGGAAPWRRRGRQMVVRWRASPIISYGGGGVRGVYYTIESLYEVRDGQNTHQR